jgi:hypothetical protein
VAAEDVQGRLGQAVDLVVTVINTAPVVTPSISPAQPTTKQNLVAVLPTDDPYGDAITYEITWLRDGLDSGEHEQALPASVTTKGEVWTGTEATLTGTAFDKDNDVWVEATLNDGLADSESVASDKVNVLNSVPSVEQAWIDPNPVREASPPVRTQHPLNPALEPAPNPACQQSSPYSRQNADARPTHLRPIARNGYPPGTRCSRVRARASPFRPRRTCTSMAEATATMAGATQRSHRRRSRWSRSSTPLAMPGSNEGMRVRRRTKPILKMTNRRVAERRFHQVPGPLGQR